jgi:hypothetical protein
MMLINYLFNIDMLVLNFVSMFTIWSTEQKLV